MLQKIFSDKSLPLLLLLSALFNIISGIVLLARFTDDFSQPLLDADSGKTAFAVLFAAVMLFFANFTYQLVIKQGIPFSRPMLVGFVVCEIAYSGFMLALRPA
jgi:hypothetical protein